MTEAIITIEDAQNPSPDKILKIVHISGQLDESNIDEKIQEIYKVLEANPKGLSLIFDMENLEYMNSKSIGYLTDLYGKVTEANGQVAIAKAKSNILDILQVVGLTQLIKTFDSTDEAKNYITAATPASAPAAVPTVETPAATMPIAQAAPAPVEVPMPATPEAMPAPAPQAPAPETTPPPMPEASTPVEAPITVTPEATPPPATPAEAPTPAPDPNQTGGTFNINQ